MDRVRLGYDLVRAYVYALVLAAVLTALWFVAPRVAAAPDVASVWFAVAGFGALVVLVFALTQYGRN
ncbi:hypothetical protein [Halobacterium litoreum]|uniref:Uncharacterized protein n=1 Tax=Halobacterium litoreum TaxID=2039234 RepID=A0ABD5NHY4_9EURY|nr:hypothetical protein [Halobacterium litoreum]UHH12297.1 hypothetical protein LT972_09015 [Halobacterium litoreum]